MKAVQIYILKIKKMIDIFLSSFFIGVIGSTHCLSMCAGISCLVCMNKKNSNIHIIMYNLGRISSYVIAGILVTYLSSLLFSLISLSKYLITLKILANLLVCFIGLYLLGISSIIKSLEHFGFFIWTKSFSKLTKPFSSNSLTSRIFTGFIWGWIPCGLVYSSLSYAALTGDILQGSLIMLCFGLGTLPMMFFVGKASLQSKGLIFKKYIKYIGGLSLVIYGLFSIILNLRSVLSI
ncbi:cytochrome biogenesis protein [Paraphotobacterium marinum]|uniref:Cytochrome biogenesis protein n=2 Tax=Paraphotobacterium marinum TaxID=1755811 RepID=A0A220VEL9_9GAMM|nr:cytochrome biogenesis protein [Paraphotobacterium marinum]